MHLRNITYPGKLVEAKYPSLITLIENISQQHGYISIQNDGKAVVNINFSASEGPVRVVVRRSSYRQTYQLFSKKTQKTMSCESLIEFNGCYILESIQAVKTYQMQPAVITYLIAGERHRHIPDALVELTNKEKFFIEFKAESQLDDEELIRRTEILGKNLSAHGYGYMVVCDDQVSGIPLSNAKQLFHSQKTKIPQQTLMEIKNQFDIKATLYVAELITAICYAPLIKNYLYQLMLNGVIGYDRAQLITAESEICWKGSTK